MSEKPVASIKTLARYEPDTVYIGTGEYVAECVRADDGDYYLAADVDAAIEALLAEVDALAKDAAKYRWGINNARWVRSEQEAYVAIPVAPDADLSCVAMRDAAIDAAMAQEGEQ